MLGPTRIRWSDHALVKAAAFGLARADVEAVVLEGHATRQRNAGAARWRVSTGRLVVLYEHPDGDDETTARVVTLWRRR